MRRRLARTVLLAAAVAGVLAALPRVRNEWGRPRPPAPQRGSVTSPVIRAAVQATRPADDRRLPEDRRLTVTLRGQGAGAANAGMVAAIDPETGQLGMPNEAQMRRISESEQARLSHSSVGLVEVHHPDGSVSVDVQGRFQEFETVRIGRDGKKTFRCVSDTTAGSDAAAGRSAPGAAPAPAPKPQPAEER